MKVAAIYRYPVKSLRGAALEHIFVERIGLSGDRRWMVVDANGQCQTIREHPVMTQIATEYTSDGLTLSHPSTGRVSAPVPGSSAAVRMVNVWGDNIEALEAGSETNDFLARTLGFPARLVYMSDPDSRAIDPQYANPDDRTSFADGFPLLLTTTSSLDDLNARLAHPVEMSRFRPNIVIEGAPAWAEDEWRIIAIAGIPFRIAKPCGRCVVITRDAMTGVQSDQSEPLRTLGQFRRSASGKVIFGQNLIPDATGTITVGDEVTIIEKGASNLL